MEKIKKTNKMVRRKSAVERLAETKYNYIKSSPTTTVDRDGKERRAVQRSLSTSALRPSLVFLTQSPAILLTKSGGDCHQSLSNHSNTKCQQSIQSSGLPNGCSTSPTNAQPVVTRKRNPSLSSRLSSEGSHNLEQQLRQLIAENNEEQNSDNQLTRAQNKETDLKPKVINSANETTLKPIPKERLKTTNQQILRQNVIPSVVPNVVPKQRTIFTNNVSNDKTIVDNKRTSNNSILRYNSSLNNSSNNKTTINSKLIIQSKPLTQPLVREKSIPAIAISSNIRSTSTTSPSYRQMSISRSKSDVSNRLLLRRNKSKDEIERFFETLGLDSTVWDSIRSEATNSLISTPAHYFESCDSFESSDVRHAVMSSSSSSSSSDRHSTSAQPTVQRHQILNTRLMQSRSCHALSSGTSIVEKNARVIKWLYNCRKAMVEQ